MRFVNTYQPQLPSTEEAFCPFLVDDREFYNLIIVSCCCFGVAGMTITWAIMKRLSDDKIRGLNNRCERLETEAINQEFVVSFNRNRQLETSTDEHGHVSVSLPENLVFHCVQYELLLKNQNNKMQNLALDEVGEDAALFVTPGRRAEAGPSKGRE